MCEAGLPVSLLGAPEDVSSIGFESVAERIDLGDIVRVQVHEICACRVAGHMPSDRQMPIACRSRERDQCLSRVGGRSFRERAPSGRLAGLEGGKDRPQLLQEMCPGLRRAAHRRDASTLDT